MGGLIWWFLSIPHAHTPLYMKIRQSGKEEASIVASVDLQQMYHFTEQTIIITGWSYIWLPLHTNIWELICLIVPYYCRTNFPTHILKILSGWAIIDAQPHSSSGSEPPWWELLDRSDIRSHMKMIYPSGQSKSISYPLFISTHKRLSTF